MSRPARAPARAPSTAAQGRLRIVGGDWKRTPLPVPGVPGLRPTPDRVRETVFNWLGGRLDGWRVLDLFAGSGALGLEAASRGAAEVVLVEHDRRAAAAIEATLARLRAQGSPRAAQVQLRIADAVATLAALAADARRFDLMLLDPPFGAGWLARVAPGLASVAAPRARLYAEAVSPEALAPLIEAGWRVTHGARAGQVHYHLLQAAPEVGPA